MGRPKKVKEVEEVVEIKEEELEVSAAELEAIPEAHGFSEQAVLTSRQEELLRLRQAMTSNGIDSIGKLDVLLSQVNSRLAELAR